MKLRSVVIFVLASCVYWAIGLSWAGDATYQWAANPEFGITDEMSPWPHRLVLIVFVLVLMIYFFAAKRKSGKSE